MLNRECKLSLIKKKNFAIIFNCQLFKSEYLKFKMYFRQMGNPGLKHLEAQDQSLTFQLYEFSKKNS